VTEQQRPTVRQCLDVLEAAYDPSTAESWDAVGLVTGDPAAPVGHVLFAVDPTEAVAAEAVASGAQLLVTHHPLFLGGVSSVAETSAGGRTVATLIRGGCALYAAHTNADVACPGVSDALAALFGVVDGDPLRPLAGGDGDSGGGSLDKLVVFVPHDDRPRLLDALAAAGAGAIGDYDRCAWWSSGTGTFRPLAGANPAIGEVGAIEEVAESRLEMVVPHARRAAVLAALRATHPYEEPAFDLIPLAGATLTERRGLGRVGDLPEPQSLSALLDRAVAALPRTAWGVRATGDPDRPVRRLAVCGGSGGELAAAAARAGADAFLTADARHHYTLDAIAASDLAVLDAAHWATEWPWLADAARVLREGLAGAIGTRTGFGTDPTGGADSVAVPTTSLPISVPTTAVSTLVTDPWRLHRC
jgi:dinuclear metal center YbgI/SA1388 family protein